MMHIGDPYEDLPKTPKMRFVDFPKWASWEFLSVFQVLVSLVIAATYAVQSKWGFATLWVLTAAVWGGTSWRIRKVRLSEAKSRAVLEEASTAPLGRNPN
jgi:hypothetical protein